MKSLSVIFFLFAVVFVSTHARALHSYEQTGLLQYHNRVRADVRSLAASMPDLVWDANLATVARNYAETCIWEHNPNRRTQYQQLSGSSLSVGENLAIGSPSTTYFSALNLTAGWENEKNFWNYNTGCTAGKVCGHYTQLVWAATTRVGCGFATCTNVDVGDGDIWATASIHVCNYASAGNVAGQKPWSLPTPATAPVAAPKAATPVAAPKAPTPVAAPKAATPVAAPKAPTPVAAPKAPTPVAAPKAPTPVAAPKAPTPVAAPKAAPSTSPIATGPSASSPLELVTPNSGISLATSGIFVIAGAILAVAFC